MLFGVAEERPEWCCLGWRRRAAEGVGLLFRAAQEGVYTLWAGCVGQRVRTPNARYASSRPQACTRSCCATTCCTMEVAAAALPQQCVVCGASGASAFPAQAASGGVRRPAKKKQRTIQRGSRSGEWRATDHGPDGGRPPTQCGTALPYAEAGQVGPTVTPPDPDSKRYQRKAAKRARTAGRWWKKMTLLHGDVDKCAKGNVVWTPRAFDEWWAKADAENGAL